MYDATQEPNEFVGDDREGAVAKACQFFDVEQSDLKVVEPPMGSIAGAGARIVVVAVPTSVKPRPRREEREGDRDRERGRDRDRGRGRDRGERGERGGRDRGGRGRERGGRGQDRDRAQAAPDREESGSYAPGGSKGTVSGEIGPIGEFLLGVVERMDLGNFEISESAEDDFLVFQLSGPGAAELGSGETRAAEALQLLANQAAMRGSDDAPRVVIDVEGSTARREGDLEELASRAVRRALDTGRSVALDPMDGKDRRIIHMTVREQDSVATMSIGEGRYRQVLIVPEGADEYEEAQASSRDSG